METLQRSSDGRFSSLKARAVAAYTWFFARLLWFAFGAITFTILFSQEPAQPITVVEVVHAAEQVDKLALAKEDVIDRLLSCESAGYTEDDAIIIYDNNKAGTLTGKNVWSLGQLQWKVPTIQHYVKMRDGIELTQKEAVELALDTEKARALASYVIFETDKGLSNWLNCANKLELAPEVMVLKKLAV